MGLVKEVFYQVVGVDELSKIEHSHPNTYEIIQILGGEGEFIVHSKAFHIKPGILLFIDAENFHCSAPQDYQTYIRNKIIVSKADFLRTMESFGLLKQVDRLFDSAYGVSVCLNEHASLALDKSFQVIYNKQDSFESAAALLDIVNTLYTKKQPNSEQNGMITEILEALSISLDSEFSLDALSKKIGLDKYYLCHYFKAKTGITITEYLRWMRINMAKKLLAERNASISQIANTCGYNSLAYFSKCFKDDTGMTPRQYVKTIQQ